ncbi:hypothetical protein BJV74DRAFT_898902 [Russula compacta]|nr:hypothetical protein BJV74DRAFT_898902 [Russula compacta]
MGGTAIITINPPWGAQGGEEEREARRARLVGMRQDRTRMRGKGVVDVGLGFCATVPPTAPHAKAAERPYGAVHTCYSNSYSDDHSTAQYGIKNQRKEGGCAIKQWQRSSEAATQPSQGFAPPRRSSYGHTRPRRDERQGNEYGERGQVVGGKGSDALPILPATQPTDHTTLRMAPALVLRRWLSSGDPSTPEGSTPRLVMSSMHVLSNVKAQPGRGTVQPPAAGRPRHTTQPAVPSSVRSATPVTRIWGVRELVTREICM